MSDITHDYDAEESPETYGNGFRQHSRLSPVQPGYAAAGDDSGFDSDVDDCELEDEHAAAGEAHEDEESAEPARTGLEPLVPGQTGGFGIADVLFPAVPPPVKHARVIRSFG
jgi:hypothetical protein